MRIADHMEKARRIEETMLRKLDPDTDYEIYVEACMLAGTHLLNAVLHQRGITTETADLLHSDKPALSAPVEEELRPLFSAMKFIEDLRPGYLRGTVAWSRQHGTECERCFGEVKAYAQRMLRKQAGDS